MAEEASSLVVFASELMRASDTVEQITPSERGELLLWAANILCTLRGDAPFTGLPTANRPGDLAFGLREMSETPEVFSAGVVSTALLEAADMILALRVMLKSKVAAPASTGGRFEKLA